MNSNDFVSSLLAEMHEIFSDLALEPEVEPSREAIPRLLRIALVGELEASEIAGFWISTTPEIEAKAALAEQCGDEMKHYQLIATRLGELGDDLKDFQPGQGGYSPLYHYLSSLRSTPERVASGLFTQEAIAVVRNQQFMEYCRLVGDQETADLYEHVIHPEEVYHHEMGRDLLLEYASDAATQEKVKAAVHSTLAISDELRELKQKSTGLPILPIS